MPPKPSAEQQLNKVTVAAKSLKQAVERAARILWANPTAAEKMLNEALKRAEEDGL